MLNINSYSQEYKIISSEQAKSMMSKEQPVLIKKNNENDCNIYFLKGKYILYSSLSKYSLLFDKAEAIDNMDFNNLPIGIETDDVRETEQDKIWDIPNNISCYIDEIEKKFEIHLGFQDLKYLEDLDRKIYDYGIENISERDLFMISLYLDEFFRINTNTNWVIEKIFTLKTYWIPFIKDTNTNKEYSFYRAIFESYSDNESGCLNLTLNYLLQLADYKNLAPLSKEYIEFINSNINNITN